MSEKVEEYSGEDGGSEKLEEKTGEDGGGAKTSLPTLSLLRPSAAEDPATTFNLLLCYCTVVVD
jgi:hypothetical protein